MSLAPPTETDPVAPNDRRTARAGDTLGPSVEWIGEGGQRRLVVRSHDVARAVLRLAEGTEQAGFNADQLRKATLFKQPMIYTEGLEHREQRRLAARFFSPRTVSTRHRQFITEFADEIVGDLERAGGGRLDLAAFRLAVRVVNSVVGVTESDEERMLGLLESFFAVPPPPEAARWRHAKYMALNNLSTVRYWWGHVRPAIKARRAQPQDDVLSALIAKGLRDRDIVIECVTYAAAGMVTTRQLMTAAAWHLLDRPELRDRFVGGDDADRAKVIAELLRLETVAGTLLRRATAPLTLETPDGPLEVPTGTIIDLQVRLANADPATFGADSLSLRPDRCPVSGASATGLAFGAGEHSCPGEYLALEETDLFLQRLLRSRWEVVEEPEVVYNDFVQGYDLAPLTVRLVG